MSRVLFNELDSGDCVFVFVCEGQYVHGTSTNQIIETAG